MTNRELLKRAQESVNGHSDLFEPLMAKIKAERLDWLSQDFAKEGILGTYAFLGLTIASLALERAASRDLNQECLLATRTLKTIHGTLSHVENSLARCHVVPADNAGMPRVIMACIRTPYGIRGNLYRLRKGQAGVAVQVQ